MRLIPMVNVVQNASFLFSLLFVAHETFQAIIQSIHEGRVMNW